MTVASDRLQFPGSQGQQLAARLDRPAGPPVAYALFAHCFTCSKDVFAAARIATALAERGIAVLRFDFTGLGSSEGEFGNADFSGNVQDLVAAADFLRREHRAPALLVGHSLGGAAVLAAAGEIPEVQAVATLGAPCDPVHVRHLIADSAETIAREGEATVEIGGRRFCIRNSFLEDLDEQRMRERIANLRKPLLVAHSPQDPVVGVDNARRIFEAARHPKTFLSLDGADHLITRRADARWVAEVIAAWAGRYIGGGEAGTAPPEHAEAGEVVVTETGEAFFTQAIAAGPHHLRADEPERHGGTDTGPGPYDLLMAALGACTAMTIRMYADRKRWPLHKVQVRLAHHKIHAEDCAHCETPSGKIDHIERLVTLHGDLSPDQRQRLLEIADKCPVHRTLHSEVDVDTRLTA